ncbi:MAG: TetR/AcrR family transcriptional regulator [Bacteroidota bacterium]|jgi:AcrR family transcriptional regulator|nr:TetR/AcrR family transcriptional regulator [Bacteroidota bacterium]HHU96216.1 TetR/AcrR family transcriptional regulator [Petrimonas sp.]
MEPLTTEQKIIKAASKLFTQKGYAATKTREIAEEADINLALLNYYFGSKERLYKEVVKNNLGMLLEVMIPILSDEKVSLKEKVVTIAENYTQLLLEHEELPIFILNEWTVNEDLFVDITRDARLFAKPVIEKQLKENGMEVSVDDFIANLLSLIMFSFVAKPLIVSSGLVEEGEFANFVNRRKEKIWEWMTKINQ